MNRDQTKRLGSSSAEANDILSHPFFRDINWADLRAKRIPAVYKPMVSSPHDTRNIDKMFTNEKPVETPEQTIPNTIAMKTTFEKFTFERGGVDEVRASRNREAAAAAQQQNA